MKDIRIIENCSEIGAGTRGSRLGIEALKIASIQANSSYFSRHNSFQISDRNDLLYVENETPSAIRIQGIVEVYQNIANAVANSLKENKFPLVLAGDHASAGGTIAGIKKAFPDKRLGVIWIDAHADLHSPFTSPSGNVHGMPLATAIADDNAENGKSQPSEKAIAHWEELKHIGGMSPKIHSEDLIFFGVRDTELPEEKLMGAHRIKNYTVSECRELGVKSCAQSAIDKIADCDWIYISFDVDSMDPDLTSYGTGTPVAEGFSPQEAHDLIHELIIGSKKVCCFEMVEVNPLLDNKGNVMAETAFEILESTTEKLIEHGL